MRWKTAKLAGHRHQGPRSYWDALHLHLLAPQCLDASDLDLAFVLPAMATARCCLFGRAAHHATSGLERARAHKAAFCALLVLLLLQQERSVLGLAATRGGPRRAYHVLPLTEKGGGRTKSVSTHARRLAQEQEIEAIAKLAGSTEEG